MSRPVTCGLAGVTAARITAPPVTAPPVTAAPSPPRRHLRADVADGVVGQPLRDRGHQLPALLVGEPGELTTQADRLQVPRKVSAEMERLLPADHDLDLR